MKNPALSPRRPLLGRWIGALAQGFGQDSLWGASRSQKAWIADAREVLPILFHNGILPAGVGLVVLEDRPPWLFLEHFAAPYLERAARESSSPASFHRRHGSTLAGVIQVGDPRGESTMLALAGHFQSERDARRFVIAHEAAHAWQAFTPGRFARAACEARDDVLGAHALACAMAFEDWNACPKAQSVAACIEEAACDAIAGWILLRMGRCDAFEACARFRKESSGPVHRTDWLLEPLAQMSQWPWDLNAFAKLLDDLFRDKSRAVFDREF